MKLKLNIFLTLLTIAALAVAACGPAATEAPTAAPTEAPPPTTAPTTAPEPAATEAPTEVAAPEAGEPYVIGAFFSTTGPTSSLGQPEWGTVIMIAEHLNGDGGILGPDGKMHKLDVRKYDDQSDATKAVEIVKKLIEEDKAPVIIGGSGSPASIAVIESVTTAEVPFISVASSSKIVNAADGTQNKWVFKTPQQNYPVASVQADWMKAHRMTKIASLGVNNAFGVDSMDALKTVAAESGFEIVWEGTFEPRDTDFTSQLTAIQGTDAEVLIVHATPGEGAPLTVQFRAMGFEIPIVHNHGIGNQAFIDTASADAEGVLFPIGKLLVAAQLPDSDPQKATLLKYQEEYISAFGKKPSTFGGHAWDAMMMVIEALQAVGPDSAAMRDYFENKITNWVGISGVFNISPQDHTGIGKESLVLVKIDGGAWTYVDPSDYANVP
ncbi:MAG TPA: ABC transporter substrate-binding protein [Anaerolineales bacterium]|nr:ABC transporter substrate-binding protein [Anaerolineales bacterium]